MQGKMEIKIETKMKMKIRMASNAKSEYQIKTINDVVEY